MSVAQNCAYHSPDVEQIEPGFERTLQAVLEGDETTYAGRDQQKSLPRNSLITDSALLKAVTLVFRLRFFFGK